MKCEKIREQMLDLMTTQAPPEPEVQEHLGGCEKCAAEFESMKQTMALLDEWQAPEPSPFFNTRLNALVREEKNKVAEKKSWILEWFRKPVLAAAAAVALMVGAGVYAGLESANSHRPDTVMAQQDTAVHDLQTLDNDQDVINNFAALDDSSPSDDNGASASTTE